MPSSPPTGESDGEFPRWFVRLVAATRRSLTLSRAPTWWPAIRLLLVSDLHYTLRQLDWVVGAAPGYDLVVVAGDHLDINSPVPLGAQTVVILQYVSLLQQAGPLVISSGNHDLTGPDDNGEQAALWLAGAREHGANTDGDSLEIGDVLVTVCPWWDGPIGRDAVAAQLARDAARRPKHWIWVYHWPPFGSPTCWTGKRHYGDEELPAWIAQHQPEIVLCGHVHQPPSRPDGAWADRIGHTWVFNSGTQIGSMPAHVEIDLEAGEAVWNSLLGTEWADLTAETAPERTVF